MIRSLGGWTAIKERGEALEFYKSDERILGDSDFVERALRHAREVWHRQHALQIQGITVDHLLQVVAKVM